jgi:uncharacterized membrane protein YjgN (DUF898 family)
VSPAATGELGQLAEPHEVLASRHVADLRFTGRGAEYFRIWVVNLLLTLLTLGVYSAWAKVRKTRYFRQNTQLDGHVFDFHGNPAAIFRGRVLAMLLLGAYTWAFNFSLAAGLTTVAALCVSGPWLFMRAQQFSLANTSFRGLRFGFQARTGEAYRNVLPVLGLWLAPTIVAALIKGEEGWFVLALGLTPVVAFPWMHHRLKAYQRRNATYGDRLFSFAPATARFYIVYAKGLGFVLIGLLFVAVAIGALAAWKRRAAFSVDSMTVEGAIYGVLAGLVLYVLVWPYYAARLQQVVWSRTHLGDIHFSTDIRARSLFRLVLHNVTLTILTGGLYWPWAAIALARYRIECVRVDSPAPLSILAAGLEGPPVSAAGVGAADAFGIDIGL